MRVSIASLPAPSDNRLEPDLIPGPSLTNHLAQADRDLLSVALSPSVLSSSAISGGGYLASQVSVHASRENVMTQWRGLGIGEDHDQGWKSEGKGEFRPRDGSRKEVNPHTVESRKLTPSSFGAGGLGTEPSLSEDDVTTRRNGEGGGENDSDGSISSVRAHVGEELDDCECIPFSSASGLLPTSPSIVLSRYRDRRVGAGREH